MSSSKPFTPTPEQLAIAQALKEEKGNLAIDAGAGTGKTSTLIYLVREVLPRGGILVCVFNKSNKIDIEKKLTAAGLQWKDASAKTFDGLAFSLFTRKYPLNGAEPDSHKYSTLARWWVRRHLSPTLTLQMRKTATRFLESLFHFWVCNTTRDHKSGSLKLFVGGTLAETDESLVNHAFDIAAMIVNRYGLDVDYEESDAEDVTIAQAIARDMNLLITRGLPDLIRLGRAAFADPRSVAAELVDEDGDPIYDGLASGKIWASFQDMSYWAVVENWRPSFQNSIVMVDEAQDLSPLQRAVVDMHVRRGGRVIIVGDEAQAINMWNGADSDGFSNSKIFWNISTVKPLTVCWRCGKSIVELASNWKPGFQAAPNAIEGVIANMHDDDVIKFIHDGDAIISRLRSQLVVWWRKMVKANIPAKIVGQNPAEIVIRLLEKIADQKGFEFKHLKKHIDQYELAQIQRLTERKRPEHEILALQDEIETVRAMVEDVQVSSLEALIAKIRDELDPRKMPLNGVTILTGHTAKGGEWPQVFCVTPEKFPLSYRDQSDEEYEQECNLEYVMQTRAMNALFFVSKEHKRYDPNAPKETLEDRANKLVPYDPILDDDDDDWEDPVDEGFEMTAQELARVKAAIAADTHSPMGETPALPTAPLFDLGAAVFHNDKPARVVETKEFARVIEYVGEPGTKTIATEFLSSRQRPALPTEPVKLEMSTPGARFDQSRIRLGEVSNDPGAHDRARVIARALAYQDLWDGYSPLRVIDAYGIHDRVDVYVRIRQEPDALVVEAAPAPVAPVIITFEPEPAPVLPAPEEKFRATGQLSEDLARLKKRTEQMKAQGRVFELLNTLDLETAEVFQELIAEASRPNGPLPTTTDRRGADLPLLSKESLMERWTKKLTRRRRHSKMPPHTGGKMPRKQIYRAMMMAMKAWEDK